MSDKSSNSDKLSLSGKKLELKTGADAAGGGRGGSGGRGKIPVEVKPTKKKRTPTPPPATPKKTESRPESRPQKTETRGGGGGQKRTMLRTLTEEEKAQRLKVLETAKARQAAEDKAEEAARARRAAEAAQQQAEQKAAEEAKADQAAEEASEALTSQETPAAKAADTPESAESIDTAGSQAGPAAPPSAAGERESVEKPAAPKLRTDEKSTRPAAKTTRDAPASAAKTSRADDDAMLGTRRPRLIADVPETQKTERRKPAERTVSRAAQTVSSDDAVAKDPDAAGEARRGGGGGRSKQRTQEVVTAPRPAGKPSGGARRRSNKISLDDEFGQQTRTRSVASMRRRQEKEKRLAQSLNQEKEKIVRDVTVPETITVQELANRMAERGADVVKSLMTMGVMATINQSIDADTAELIVEEFGHKITRVSEADVEDVLTTADDVESDLKSRAPVVTVMGHVDHGKTSLLDAFRKTSVVVGEAGGITQHIGAYQVNTDSGAVTFLDTPGHSAFTGMRARGAKVTDIVILVVAANDGVMPQTIEAINHAKAAEVPIIVAINKMDVDGADPTRVRTELLQHEIVVEAMSGDTQDVEVSAKTGQGLEALLEAVHLQAEILELKANPAANAEAVVVEAKLDKGRGPVATVLVERGTLRRGDIFVVGNTWGRVRTLINDQGDQVEEAGPSVPVEVLGLQGTPEAGDRLIVVETESKAREIVDYRERKEKEKRAVRGAATLDQMFAQAKEGDIKELPVVIKSDVQGSTEAIVGALEKMGNNEVKVTILHSGVGGITESDVTLAGASNALIIGFNVRANAQARDLAKQQGTEIRYYSIIYDITDDVKAALSGMLSPELRETFIGYAEVLEVFTISKVGKIAGCRVTDGVVRRHAGVRQLRDDVVVYEGTIRTLKRHKDDVKEVTSGMECGIAFEANQDIKSGDMLEVFEVAEIARTIDAD